MNLIELKEAVDRAIEHAKEIGDPPEEVTISIQININREVIWSDDVDLYCDGNGCTSECVIVGDAYGSDQDDYSEIDHG